MNNPRPIVLTVNQSSYTDNPRHRENSSQRASITESFRLISFTFLLSLYALPVFSAVVINYSYDDLNRLKTVAWKDGPVQKYHYDEVGNFTSQAVSNSPDTDKDLIANFFDTDDDNDEITDDWELQYNLDPLDPSDARLDPDGDGFSNLAEFQGGTNPLQKDYPIGPLLPIINFILDESPPADPLIPITPIIVPIL